MIHVVNLRDRLIRLDPLLRKLPFEPNRPSDSFSPLQSEAHAIPSDDGVCAELGLQAADRSWIRRYRIPGLEPPAWPLPDMRGILPEWGADSRTRMRRWNDVLLLDLETTGLAGGTGTFAFLAGLGWWDDEGFQIQQIFLPRPQRESCFLEALSDITSRFRVVVTYNGGVFDLPLLATRARLNRRADPCDGLLSWDLLAAARRLWGRQLTNCRQQTVEHGVCRYGRSTWDVGGDMIPGVYRSFLGGGETTRMARVLYHNTCDIEGLGLILRAAVETATAIAEGPAFWSGEPEEAWSNALVCERRRQNREAGGWSACLVARRMLTQLPAAGVLDVIRLLKRVADWPKVELAIRDGLERWPEAPRLHYEAAVFYEHRQCDLRRAMNHAVVMNDGRRMDRLRARLKRYRPNIEVVAPIIGD